MKRFFSPNIDRTGRIVRGALSLCSFIGAVFAFGDSAWVGVGRLVRGEGVRDQDQAVAN